VQDAVIGEVSLTTDERCPDAYVFDGDFTQHALTWRKFGARIIDQPHGTSEAEIVAPNVCAESSLTTVISVPVPEGNAGPAVTFGYRYENPPAGSGFTVSAPAVRNTSADLSPSRDGHGLLCLPANRAGETLDVSWSVHGPFGACADLTETAAVVTNVAVSTDTRCVAASSP
jgi:hypothetical protein